MSREDLFEAWRRFLERLAADLGSDHRRADKVLREGLELARRAGSLSHMRWLAGSVGDIGFRPGNLEESEALQREALELAQAVGDEPLRGMRLTALASAILFRGRLDEAEAIFRESVPILNENPEPQNQIFIPQIEGRLSLARGENESAAVSFEAMIEQLRMFNVESVPQVFPDLVRALHRAGRGADARSYRDLSEHGRSPAARANVALVEGVLAEDPAEACRLLAEGVEPSRSSGCGSTRPGDGRSCSRDGDRRRGPAAGLGSCSGHPPGVRRARDPFEVEEVTAGSS